MTRWSAQGGQQGDSGPLVIRFVVHRRAPLTARDILFTECQNEQCFEAQKAQDIPAVTHTEAQVQLE